MNSQARFLLGQLSWGLPLLTATCTLAVWLLSMGAKGNQIAGTLSLPVSIVGLTMSILAFLYQTSVTDDDREGGRNGFPPRRLRRKLRRRLRLAALLTGVALGGSGGFFYWTVIHKTDLPVTDQVTASSDQEMQDGGQETIQIPGSPPQRRYLSITPTLINSAKVGDCVGPARLDLTPVIDGQHRMPVSVRPNHEARLDLTGVTRKASVLVTLHTPDSSCRVKLGVDQAVLYN